jgi:hypothetical protein
MSFQHNVALVDNTMKVYKGDASALAPDGTFSLREGFTLPTGLALANNGVLSGTPSTIGRTTVSFEYADRTNESFEENYSNKYYIDICYRHNLEININHNNGQYVSSNLELSMLHLDNKSIDGFNALTE